MKEKDCNYRDLKIGERYRVSEVTLEGTMKSERKSSTYKKEMTLIGVNPYYISFERDEGFIECFQNHIHLIQIKPLKRRKKRSNEKKK